VRLYLLAYSPWLNPVEMLTMTDVRNDMVSHPANRCSVGDGSPAYSYIATATYRLPMIFRSRYS